MGKCKARIAAGKPLDAMAVIALRSLALRRAVPAALAPKITEVMQQIVALPLPACPTGDRCDAADAAKAARYAAEMTLKDLTNKGAR